MHAQPFFRINTLLVLAVVLAAAVVAPAQNSDPDPMFDRFDQLLRQMEERSRRGIPVDTTFDGGRLQISPDSSSYFYFHIDTSFNGSGGGTDFFQFSPFGDPSSGFQDLNRIFREFFGGQDPFAPHRRQQGDWPPDDGQQRSSDEDLLPEERLRQQEENTRPDARPAQPEAAPAPKPEKPAKSKVKTIRI